MEACTQSKYGVGGGTKEECMVLVAIALPLNHRAEDLDISVC